MSKRADGDGETTYEYSVEGRLAAVKAGSRTLMAATYDGDGNRIMQASPYHEDVPGTEGSALDGGAGDEGAADEGLSLWSIGLFWYGFAAGGAAALAAANPAAMAASVEAACALVEATWPEGAFDSAASDYALSHLGLPAFDLAAMTGSYGVGEPGRTDELLDVVTYTNSSVVGDVAQVASSHSTRSGESSEVYGFDRLSKSEGGSATAYAYDGRGSVSQTLSSSGAASSWHVWGAFGEQEAGTSLGELPSYGYNAEEAHPQTGLQYLRARYYDAESGRFGVQDSYLGQASDPLSLNRYLYCLSDPLNLIDPSGHWGQSVADVFSGVFKNVMGRIFNTILQGAEEVSAIAAVARGDYSAAQRHKAMAEHYRMIVFQLSCGIAPKQSAWTYNRDLAIDYAKRYSDSMQGWNSGLEYVFGKLLGVGRNGSFPSYGANCANFVSQTLNAGGIPMTSEWHALGKLIGNKMKNGEVATWDVTRIWSVASEQYAYFSNPLNGYSSGNVINIYGATGASISGMDNVKFNDLAGEINRLGIQKGDLLYFYNAEEGVHHATVVSKVDDQGIYYAANSNRRFDEPLKNALDNEDAFRIVRLRDNGL